MGVDSLPFNTLILELLFFILSHNAFLFNDFPLLQVQGVAMGTLCAPSYAILYLGRECHIFSDIDLVYLCHTMTWHKYIDNIFVVWDGPLDLLQTFLNKLKDNRFNLSFTHNYSPQEVPFLETLVRVDDSGNLTTTLYRKPTTGNSILRSDSAHPASLKRSMPFAHHLRIRCICSSIVDFQIQA